MSDESYTYGRTPFMPLCEGKLGAAVHPSPPIFMFEKGGSTVTLHGAHYDRLLAVVAAARSGDRLLIELALAHLDEKGTAA